MQFPTHFTLANNLGVEPRAWQAPAGKVCRHLKALVGKHEPLLVGVHVDHNGAICFQSDEFATAEPVIGVEEEDLLELLERWWRIGSNLVEQVGVFAGIKKKF